MFYPKFDFPYIFYSIGPSNGTTPFSQFRLGEENTLIALESVAMCGEILLRDAPRRGTIPERTQAQLAVVASLERSLKEHADVWEELSKY
jgi:hypothetical protein